MSEEKHTPKGQEVPQPVVQPKRSFEEAVAAVLNAPPTPEQQAKKAARKARAAARKKHQKQPKPSPPQ